MASVKTKAVDPETPKTYIVRSGFVLHRERTVKNPKGGERIVVDVFNGDDPSSNEVELTDEQAKRYAHQLEPLASELDAEEAANV
ncbi:MAG: hypothetical protein MH252_08470 [Thermosynechococcaceae cyanobacterium MS004]|nr:hypothetical protein [Thermosynechococcaceae cyanobacterium MS004]